MFTFPDFTVYFDDYNDDDEKTAIASNPYRFTQPDWQWLLLLHWIYDMPFVMHRLLDAQACMHICNCSSPPSTLLTWKRLKESCYKQTCYRFTPELQIAFSFSLCFDVLRQEWVATYRNGSIFFHWQIFRFTTPVSFQCKRHIFKRKSQIGVSKSISSCDENGRRRCKNAVSGCTSVLHRDTHGCGLRRWKLMLMLTHCMELENRLMSLVADREKGICAWYFFSLHFGAC